MRSNEKNLTEYVIKGLARQGDPGPDWRGIENKGMSRRDAEVFVLRVETEHDQDIEMPGSPAVLARPGGIRRWGCFKPDFGLGDCRTGFKLSLHG
jgi:hypothetical protein